MIIDKKLELCDAVSVALTAGATAQNIGDILDMDAARDFGSGQPVYLVITCDTSIITGGAAGTIEFQLVSDGTDTISTSTQSIHLRTPKYVTDDAALNDCDAGDVIFVGALPMDGQEPYERYLALQAIVLTTDTTAGKINAFLTLDPTGWKAYPNPVGA